MSDKIKETIRKLRSMAMDTAASESEIEAAVMRADKMMREHNITIDDLRTEASRGGIIQAEWTTRYKKLPAVGYLASTITMLTETRGWVSTDEEGKQHIVFMGFSPDVEYATYLCDLINNSMESELSQFSETVAYKKAMIKNRRKMREDFSRGMAARLREKIMCVIAARRVQDGDTSSTSTELVVAKRSMISAQMESANIAPKARRKSKPKRPVDRSAFFAGVGAGDRTNITTGITEHAT